MSKILVFSGAGISKDSGIPTFEELGQDFRQNLSRSRFNKDPKGFYKDVLMMKDACDKALPNDAHKEIARYSIPVITMNIDGLHKRASAIPIEGEILELHGNMEHVHCNKCKKVFDFSVVKNDIHCPDCGTAVLQHDLVLYEDSIPKLREALRWVRKCEVLIVVGTSFYTSTSSYIYEEAMSRGKDVHIIDSDAATRLPKLIRGLR